MQILCLPFKYIIVTALLFILFQFSSNCFDKIWRKNLIKKKNKLAKNDDDDKKENINFGSAIFTSILKGSNMKLEMCLKVKK